MTSDNFLHTLESTIRDRLNNPSPESYTASLAAMGVKRIAQKVGEEAVELALASVDGDQEELLNEAADLVYHLLVMLHVQEMQFGDVIQTLETRYTG
jgi:phosphoribosyl-AMP cyclohydrolase / phosphoribosyl-ATP pyrophosphohydrolase